MPGPDGMFWQVSESVGDASVRAHRRVFYVAD